MRVIGLTMSGPAALWSSKDFRAAFTRSNVTQSDLWIMAGRWRLLLKSSSMFSSGFMSEEPGKCSSIRNFNDSCGDLALLPFF